MARTTNWRTRKAPITLAEVTPDMLEGIRRDANASKLPQTVFPTRFVGKDFVGTDCLVDSCASHGIYPGQVPEWAMGPGLVTVLPQGWFGA